MAKIVLINRYFFPDHSGSSQFLSDLAFHLAAHGREVHVIASRQRYDNAAARLPCREVIRGVAVHRVWTTAFGRGALHGRALDYMTFHVSAGVALLRLASRGDVVVAKTDPPLLSLAAWPVAKLKRAVLVNWLQDIFPEVAGALGMSWAGGWIGRLLASSRDRTLRAARLNIVPGMRMRRYLESRSVPADRLRVIHNWADGESIRPLSREGNPLRREWGLERRFVVGYSGNMGRVHEFETILEAASVLNKDAGVVFLFVGDGAGRRWLETKTASRNLSNVRFLPYQPAERLAASLSVPDLHLVSLRPEAEGLVMPSKFYGIAAAGRPTLFVGAAEGEMGSIISEERCGIVVKAGDVGGVLAAIEALRGDPARRELLGRNARRVFEARFEKKIALAAWTTALDP